MKPYTRGCYGLLVGFLICLAGVAPAANVTWDNSGGTLRWNTTEDNWVGTAFYAGGDNVTFGTTGAGIVYIGTAGPTPASVAPGSVSITAGPYTFSGGDITSGSFSKSGAGTTTFSGYTGSLTFSGGTTLAGGGGAPVVFDPANAGTYGFGSGTITLNGGAFRLKGPTTGTVTLSNNFTITAGSSYLLWDVASSTANAAIYSGDITFSGTTKTLMLGYESGYDYQRPMQLTGTINLGTADHTIRSTASLGANVPQILGNIDGGGIRSLALVDYSSQGVLLGGNGGWNLKNLNVSASGSYGMIAKVQPTTTTTDYFSGIRANGGKVNVTAGQLVLNGGAYNFNDFTDASPNGRINIDLTSLNTTILGGTLNGTAHANGIYLTPGSGVLSSNVTIGSGGVMRNVSYSSGGAYTTKFGGGDLRFLGGAVWEVATGAGDWNAIVRLSLQAQNAGDRLLLGDGSIATAETITFRGSCNVAYQNPPPTRGFIMQFDSAQVVDDGNVVLRYETPTSNPLIPPSGTASAGTYDANDRLIVGWSDRTSSTIQYQFRGGSAGTEFVPRLPSVAALGPTAGTVFTATSPTRLLTTGLVGFYNSTAAMDVGTLGQVVIANGGSLLTVSNGTMSASGITVNSGGVLGGIGKFDAASVTVAGGMIDVGNADTAGILTLTNASACALQFNGAATLAVDVRGTGAVAGTDYDRLAVKSAVTGLANVNLVVRFPLGKADFTGQTLTILTSGNDLSGQTFQSITFQDGYIGTVNYGNGFVTLTNVQRPAKGTAMRIF